MPSAPASAMVIELPSAAEEYDVSDDNTDEEDDERPLTREELQARMQRRLARQASRGDKAHRRRK
jgi:hypothetical protein